MPATPLTLAIDFGTTNSAVAYLDENNQPHALRFPVSGGGHTCPSLVDYGGATPQVGHAASRELERILDPRNRAPEEVRTEELSNIVFSIKRRLHPQKKEIFKSTDKSGAVTYPQRTHAGIVADILRHLKTTAEALRKQTATRLILTHPVEMLEPKKEVLREAARQAGFGETVLLEEPVAAARGYMLAAGGGAESAAGKQGRGVLVYDFGGGTFDSAYVHFRSDGTSTAIHTAGDSECGGDDIDQALYDYIETQAAQEWAANPESAQWEFPRGYGIDNDLLAKCRRAKEKLSATPAARIVFERALASRQGGAEGRPRPETFKIPLTRETFEQLIRPQIQKTIALTHEVRRKAEAKGYTVDTLALIGGSSQIPLVHRLLSEKFPDLMEKEKVRHTDHLDIAVVLGAMEVVRWSDAEAVQQREAEKQRLLQIQQQEAERKAQEQAQREAEEQRLRKIRQQEAEQKAQAKAYAREQRWEMFCRIIKSIFFAIFGAAICGGLCALVTAGLGEIGMLIFGSLGAIGGLYHGFNIAMNDFN